MKYAITATYNTASQGHVDLPEGKSWEDIEEWYIKWDTLNFKFRDDDAWQSQNISSVAEDTDWGHPDYPTVYAYTEDGEINYDQEIDGKE